MKRFIPIMTCSVLMGGSATALSAELPEIMSQDREMTLALSAAPEHLRAGAGVYVLKESGFVKIRDSRNGFTCIVNRDHPQALKPTCWDAEGTATIVPKVLRVGELLMQRKSLAEIDQDIAEGFRTGRFRPPSRPGIAYMLSGDIRNVTAAGTSSFPPHVMIYAPNLTNEDIGVTREALAANPTLPFIAYQGPHGYFIVSVAQQQGAASP
jgi:hypothetical protein